LQAQGVDFLIDLAGRADISWHHGGEMASQLETYTAETGYRFTHVQHDLTQYAPHTADQLQELQRVLADVLMVSHVVYLHSHYSTGQAAIAAAAYPVGQR